MVILEKNGKLCHTMSLGFNMASSVLRDTKRINKYDCGSLHRLGLQKPIQRLSPLPLKTLENENYAVAIFRDYLRFEFHKTFPVNVNTLASESENSMLNSIQNILYNEK